MRVFSTETGASTFAVGNLPELRLAMIKVVLTAFGLIFFSGCIGVRWSWEVEDGAVYETNQKSYIVDGGNFFGLLWFESEQDGLKFTEEYLDLHEVRGELSPKTKIREAKQVGMWGFSFWWYFGSQTHTTTFGEILDGPYKGRFVNMDYLRENCPKHGWWYVCPLDCSFRNLRCLTPEKYDQDHIKSNIGL